MDKKQQTKKSKKITIKIKGLDIDKAEYQQIVLSQTNSHDKNYFKRDY